MQKKRMKRTVLSVLAIALFIGVTVFSLIPYSVADAVLPLSYNEKVIDQDLDRLSDPLRLEELKHTVDLWKANGAYNFDYLKQHPIIIAVIDSGANLNHELFTGKYNPDGETNPAAADKNGVGRYDVILRDSDGVPIVKNTAYQRNSHYKENDITDDESRLHGTHVSGIVAILIHALELEEYIKIMPIKASVHRNLPADPDSFYSADVSAAVKFATDNGADVINMSLSSDTSTFAGLNRSDAHEKAVLVAAAGNDGGTDICYPAAHSNVIGVMNYTFNEENNPVLSASSNYNGKTQYYDVCAPGDTIYSADGRIVDGEYGYKHLSGTSMASPVVSFGAALLALKYRALAGAKKTMTISPTEIADLVRGAYTDTLTVNANGKDVGTCKIFDINALVSRSVYDAQIDVSDTSLLNQRLGSLKSVELKLDVVPSADYGKGTVEWFIDGNKIADGFETTYTPVEKIGETVITAVWKHTCEEHGTDVESSAAIKLRVDYMLITSANVSKMQPQTSGITNYSVGSAYTFSVADLKNIPADDAKHCRWYVNNVYAHTGETYEFTPSDEGEYEIKFSLNGFVSRANVINVTSQSPKPDKARGLKIFSITASAVIAAVAITIIVAIVLKQRKRSKDGQLK